MKTIAIFALLIAALALTGCQSPPDQEETVEGTVTLYEEGSPFIAFKIWPKTGSSATTPTQRY